MFVSFHALPLSRRRNRWPSGITSCWLFGIEAKRREPAVSSYWLPPNLLQFKPRGTGRWSFVFGSPPQVCVGSYSRPLLCHLLRH